jgi:hypothetical protein
VPDIAEIDPAPPRMWLTASSCGSTALRKLKQNGLSSRADADPTGISNLACGFLLMPISIPG